jgi:hypothetical protein
MLMLTIRRKEKNQKKSIREKFKIIEEKLFGVHNGKLANFRKISSLIHFLLSVWFLTDILLSTIKRKNSKF